MERIQECNNILKEIGRLRVKLNNTNSNEEKENILKEIQTMEQRYNNLGCGAIDPADPRNNSNP